MVSTKEEIGANAAAVVYAIVVVVAVSRGASIGEAAIRGGLCAAGSSLLGQFLGDFALRAISARPDREEQMPS